MYEDLKEIIEQYERDDSRINEIVFSYAIFHSSEDEFLRCIDNIRSEFDIDEFDMDDVSKELLRKNDSYIDKIINSKDYQYLMKNILRNNKGVNKTKLTKMVNAFLETIIQNAFLRTYSCLYDNSYIEVIEILKNRNKLYDEFSCLIELYITKLDEDFTVMKRMHILSLVIGKYISASLKSDNITMINTKNDIKKILNSELNEALEIGEAYKLEMNDLIGDGSLADINVPIDNKYNSDFIDREIFDGLLSNLEYLDDNKKEFARMDIIWAKCEKIYDELFDDSDEDEKR